ncbi:MAG TPA: enoyl-CoA hydratase/isomerase family protein [Microthrixaceae bacterium]|nr:enoyl-CoA hydratase/isomerase family protein [Microthrixaceae bacterium]HNI35682.1 enoyl-CoA hydratase/isomerase family protein [Microthrixaceae bacterium]
MELETLWYEQRGFVAVVTLNRPDRHNSFNEVMQDELRRVWQAIKADDTVRAVVLTAAGPKAFCTGIDRSDIPVTEDQFFFDPFTYDDPGKLIGPRSQELWKPVIAAVNGMACGGAFYLLGESDIIIAAEHATFFDPHVTYGMPAVFEPILMSARMPFGELMRMTLTGNAERISAETAQRMGLVSEVVPADQLLDTAVALAESIAANPPAAVQASLRTIWAARDLTPQQLQAVGNLFLAPAMTVDNLAEGQAVFSSGNRAKPRVR